MVNVMGSAAQWERRIISQRTKDALAVRRAQGVRLGRPSMLAPELVERIVREHQDGASFNEIARALTAVGMPTAHGANKWWPATVRKVLQRQESTKQAARLAAVT
jgi:DNA invertase Pin-like site-specific DNA recombinase